MTRRAALRTPLLAFVILVMVGAAGCVRPAPPGPATVRETPPPWPAPADTVSYIRAAGVEPEPYADLEDPHKVRLSVRVEGAAVPVPAWIGIDRPRAVQAPAHTHDDSGVIWVEGQASSTFTLGQFFTLWGVRLTESCVGGVCGTVEITVDGQTARRSPERLRLADARSVELSVSSS